MIKSLYLYIEENEYTRSEFENLNISEAKAKHFSISNCNLKLDDGFYVWKPDSFLTNDQPMLIKSSNENVNIVDRYHKNHLVNSVIKNLFLLPYTPTNGEAPEYIKAIAAIHVFYYHTCYNSYKVLSLDEITEGVIFHLSKTITTMIDKEHTTYRDYPVDAYISAMQIRLAMERTHDAEILQNIGASLRQ